MLSSSCSHKIFVLSTVAMIGVVSFANAIAIPVPGGDFSSPTLTHGTGNQDSLDNGWYTKNADDGVRADPDPINWSTGETVGTPDILTQLSNSGSKTRAGQFFTMDPQLTGTGWSFEFDLGGTGTFDRVRVWAGTLADAPSGNAFNSGSDAAPAAGLVDDDGWTLIADFEATVATPERKSFAITQDLGEFDVMVIKFRGRGNAPGTTYDHVEFVNDSIPNSTLGFRITDLSVDLEAGMATLTWISQSGAFYSVDESTTLGPKGWLENQDGVLGEAGETSLSIDILEEHLDARAVFFRVRQEE